MRPEHCINEIHPGCPGVTFPITYASIMPEVSLPRWKHINIWIFAGKHVPGPPYFIVQKTILPTKCVIVKYNQNFNLGKLKIF